MGVLLDNDKELEKANACYEQYLQVMKKHKHKQPTRRLLLPPSFFSSPAQLDVSLSLQASRAVGDAKGEQLALNSMAINMFKLGRYEEAIDLSNQHLQIADVAGKFVAHCNLGLAYAAMDELEQSSLNHRQALRWAQVGEQAEAEHRQVRDRDVECGRGESGVREPGERGGEEGRHADEQGVHGATPEALERPEGLQGAGEAPQRRSVRLTGMQLDANLLLGKMANEEGQYEEASSYFESAKKIAQELGDSRVRGGRGARRRREEEEEEAEDGTGGTGVQV
eukprot:250089-Hanusia_phi.AAC.5